MLVIITNIEGRDRCYSGTVDKDKDGLKD